MYGQYGEGVIGAGRYEGKFSDYGYTFSAASKDDKFANTKKDSFTDIYSTGAGQSPSVVVYPDYDYQDSIPVRNQPSVPKVRWILIMTAIASFIEKYLELFFYFISFIPLLRRFNSTSPRHQFL